VGVTLVIKSPSRVDETSQKWPVKNGAPLSILTNDKLTPVHCPLEYKQLETRVVLGKVATFLSLAVCDDRRSWPSEAQHFAAIVPLMLAKYSMYETQQRYPRGSNTGPRT
jgi:hypothetical protein